MWYPFTVFHEIIIFFHEKHKKHEKFKLLAIIIIFFVTFVFFVEEKMFP